MSRPMQQIPDLSYRIDPDGPWVDLEQAAGCGEVSNITLHHIHLRLLFEETGHLLPPPTADELSKRLAKQLYDALHDLTDEAGVSPSVDRLIYRLTALVEMLPNSLLEHEKENDKPASDRPDFKLTHTKTQAKKP